MHHAESVEALSAVGDWGPQCQMDASDEPDLTTAHTSTPLSKSSNGRRRHAKAPHETTSHLFRVGVATLSCNLLD
jgi:hypothetical protein